MIRNVGRSDCSALCPGPGFPFRRDRDVDDSTIAIERILNRLVVRLLLAVLEDLLGPRLLRTQDERTDAGDLPEGINLHITNQGISGNDVDEGMLHDQQQVLDDVGANPLLSATHQPVGDCLTDFIHQQQDAASLLVPLPRAQTLRQPPQVLKRFSQGVVNDPLSRLHRVGATTERSAGVGALLFTLRG